MVPISLVPISRSRTVLCIHLLKGAVEQQAGSGIHGGAVVYLTVNTTQVNTTVGRPRHLLFEYAQYNIYWCLLVLVQEKVWS